MNVWKTIAICLAVCFAYHLGMGILLKRPKHQELEQFHASVRLEGNDFVVYVRDTRDNSTWYSAATTGWKLRYINYRD